MLNEIFHISGLHWAILAVTSISGQSMLEGLRNTTQKVIK
jgi:hypothetical protein